MQRLTGMWYLAPILAALASVPLSGQAPPDGAIPPLTPQAARRRSALEAATQRLPAGPEDLSDVLRCISFGVPRLGGALGAGPYGYYQIVQSPGYLVLFMESIHDARIIPL